MSNGGLTLLGGLAAGAKPGKVDVERAAKAGAQVFRTEETKGDSPSLKEMSKWCSESAIKLCWITYLLGHTEVNETNKKTLVEQHEALGKSEKEALVLIEHGNEFWPGGAFGGLVNGKEMAEAFIGVAKAFREKEIPVPLGMEIQISEDGNQQKWTEEIGKVSHAELTAALEPRAWLPSGNWLVFHPYGVKMTVPETHPNTLLGEGAYSYGGSEVDPTPSKEKEWGSQRWMKAQALVKEWTGPTVPMALTEFGVRNAVKAGEEEWWRVASNAAKAEYVIALWAFMRKVQRGEVTTAPSGLVPVVGLACWYDEYSSEPSGANSYGILETTGTPIEEGHVYREFKAGIAELHTAGTRWSEATRKWSAETITWLEAGKNPL